MKINPITRGDAIRAMNIGESILWLPEFENIRTDQQQLHQAARRENAKVTISRMLLCADGEKSETVLLVKRTG